jgi:hypothetical protein
MYFGSVNLTKTIAKKTYFFIKSGNLMPLQIKGYGFYLAFLAYHFEIMQKRIYITLIKTNCDYMWKMTTTVQVKENIKH